MKAGTPRSVRPEDEFVDRIEIKPAEALVQPALESEPQSIALSEDDLALEFARDHRASFRFMPGPGWMVNLGDRWAQDDQLGHFNAVRESCRLHALRCGPGSDAMRLSSAKIVAAITKLAQSDPRIATPAAAWDADRAELNTPEGVVDLRTGQLRSRDDADLFTQVTRVSPIALECPTWRRFVRDVFQDDVELIEFIQRLLGYVLSGDRSEQKIFFFYGLGANGKSVLADFVLWVLGTYAIKQPANVLMHSPIDRHPTELAQLRGKRLAISSELEEGQFWAEARIKELTGDAELTARFMRQDFFTFPMTQKHVVVGNYKPRLRGGDAALARRFVLVPFLAKFEGAKCDPRMDQKLRAEAPAILRWMVDGAVKWHADGLRIPETVTRASREYLADNDDVALWLAECCEMQTGSSTKASDLYESFASWIKGRGQHAPSMRLFGDRMSVIPGLQKKASNGVRYVGVRLAEGEAARQLQSMARGSWR